MIGIALSRLHFPVTALGPGKRIGLWVQGCSIRCPGCISADTWARGRDTVPIADVCDALAEWLPEAHGITLTGGEPLEQSAGLHQLLRIVRPRLEGDILLYTGRNREQALTDPLVESGLVDAIIPEPYRRALSQSRTLRGSDNQPLIPLTTLGEERYQPLIEAPPDRRLDVVFDPDGAGGLWIAGIPAPGDLDHMADALGQSGHRVATSADRRPIVPERPVE